MAETPDVRLEQVVKRFDDVVAVDGISLDVPAGSFFALLGPSGCGKTTTLRMIGGFEEPDAGRIELGGRDVVGLPPYRRDVNTVFQSYSLFPHLSIFENVAFGLRRRGEREVAGQVQELLALVELSGYGGRRPSELSGGQQQRIALARALINQPRVLLLDEPLGALDLKLRRQMQLELKRIQTEVGVTFVHVTHDQEEAMTMADAIAVMNHGRVEQLGSPEELYERPATAFVASFLGQSNLLDGTVSGRDGDDVLVDVGGHRLVVPAEAAVERSGRVQVGVRPEKLVMLPPDEPLPPGRNRLEGTIVDASYLGTSTQYVIDTAWGQALTVFAQNTHRDERLVPGVRVQLTWDPVHTFAVHAEDVTAPPAEVTPSAPDEPETPGTVADAVAGDGRR